MKGTYLSARVIIVSWEDEGRKTGASSCRVQTTSLWSWLINIIKNGVPYKELGKGIIFASRREDRIVKESPSNGLRDLGYEVELKKAA